MRQRRKSLWWLLGEEEVQQVRVQEQVLVRVQQQVRQQPVQQALVQVREPVQVQP